MTAEVGPEHDSLLQGIRGALETQNGALQRLSQDLSKYSTTEETTKRIAVLEKSIESKTRKRRIVSTISGVILALIVGVAAYHKADDASSHVNAESHARALGLCNGLNQVVDTKIKPIIELVTNPTPYPPNATSSQKSQINSNNTLKLKFRQEVEGQVLTHFPCSQLANPSIGVHK